MRDRDVAAGVRQEWTGVPGLLVLVLFCDCCNVLSHSDQLKPVKLLAPTEALERLLYASRPDTV